MNTIRYSARSARLSMHKIFTSYIRWCLVSRTCDWVMSALSSVLLIYSHQCLPALLPRRSTRRHSGVKFGGRETGKIVRCLPGKKTKISPGSTAVASGQITPKICHCQPPTMCWERSIFHPNRFIFGGVIAKRVNIAKTRRKVNPIFVWSLALSRITIMCRVWRKTLIYVCQRPEFVFKGLELQL